VVVWAKKIEGQFLFKRKGRKGEIGRRFGVVLGLWNFDDF
jgi:hypothetical protein